MSVRGGKALGWAVAGVGIACVVGLLLFRHEPGPLPDTLLHRVGTRVARMLHWLGGSSSESVPQGSGKPEPRPISSLRTSDAVTGEARLSLGGRVVDELKQPVAGVRIVLRQANSSQVAAEVLTDSDGRFEFAEIASGSYDILALHPDYVPLIRPGYTPPATRRREEIEFVLPLGATLVGSVRDEDGHAVAHALVNAKRRKLEQSSAGGQIFLDDSTYKTAETDHEGTFTLKGIGLGENLFEIRCRGYDVLVESLDVTADTAKKELKFTLHRSGRIGGIVTDDKDRPLSSATVKLVAYKPLGEPLQPLEGPGYETSTGSNGDFHFAKLATEGFYDLVVEHPDYAPARYALVPVGTERQVCTLTRGGTIRGSAVFIDRPTTPAAVAIAAQTLIDGTTFTREVKSDGSGRFSFTRLPYGHYRLYVTTPGYNSEPLSGIVCSRETPQRDVLVEVYEVCRARGRVLATETDTPIGGATVILESLYGPLQARSRTATVSTDALGVFEFSSVPAGLQRVQAKARGYVPSSSGGSAQTFILLPGERKTDLTLRLGRGGTVDGFVLDHTGRAISEAEVQLFVSATTPRALDVSSLKCKTDASGYFKLWGIDVGEHLQMYASAAKNGYARARSSLIDLTASKPYATTQIELKPGASIRGTVRDERQLPIAGARVEFESLEFPKDPSYKPHSVQTAADGSYVLTHCTAGRARLHVAKAGFVDAHRELRLNEGETKENVDFTLTAGLRITGRLVTLEGKPIANARVRAVPHKFVPGRDETLTDKAGNFTLGNLGKGLFDVRANFTLKTPDGEQGYEFFKLDVKSGTANLEIACDVNNSLVGTVEGEDRRLVDNFRLVLRSRGDTRPAQEFSFVHEKSYSSARGFFRVLNIPRGIYSMTLVADGYEVYQNDNVVVGPSRRTMLPRIRLKSAGGVIGYVYSSVTDRPINDVTVRLANPQKSEEEAEQSALTARTDYSGFFRLATAGAGTYVLELEHPNYISARIVPVAVRQRGTTDLGRIYLEAGGSVQGTVMDEAGYGVSWAKVRVSGVFPARTVRTNSFGNYLIQGVRPGRWPLVVDGQVNGRRVYVYRLVDIVAGETREENFVLETSANARGTVVSSQGTVRSAAIRLHPFDEFSNVIEDIRYDGWLSGQEFRITAVPPGPYFLWATGYGPLSTYAFWQTVYLEPGENWLRLEIPSGRVSGLVSDSTGAPAAGVALQLAPIFDAFSVPRSVYQSLVRRVTTTATGEFRFEHVSPGSHQLMYFDPRVVGGGQWLALPPFWLAPGQALGGLSIPLGK